MPESNSNGQPAGRPEGCRRCRFWEPLENQSEDRHLDDREGHCHRYPPKLNLEAVKEEMREAGEDALEAEGNEYAWGFPVTSGAEWCGEFQPAPGGAQPAPDESTLSRPVVELFADAGRGGQTGRKALAVLLSRWKRRHLPPGVSSYRIPESLEATIPPMTIGDLVAMTAVELLGHKNFGAVKLASVREALARRGLRLRGDTLPFAAGYNELKPKGGSGERPGVGG